MEQKYFVSFSQAKKLKSLKFPAGRRFVGYSNKGYFTNVIESVYDYNDIDDYSRKYVHYEAPLICEVITWLKETHGIDIVICAIKDDLAFEDAISDRIDKALDFLLEKKEAEQKMIKEIADKNHEAKMMAIKHLENEN